MGCALSGLCAIFASGFVSGPALAGVPALAGMGDLEREEYDDGTFTYVLPSADAAPADFEEGGITWKYDGQELLTDRVDVSRGDFSQLERDDVPGTMTRRENIMETLRVDRWGRRWVPEFIDEAVIVAKLAAYADATESPDYAGYTLDVPAVAVDADDRTSGSEVWTEHNLFCTSYSNWTCSQCGGGSGDGDDTFVYDAESRSHATLPRPTACTIPTVPSATSAAQALPTRARCAPERTIKRARCALRLTR